MSDETIDYLVRWEIQLTAPSPLEAAREALRVQRDPGSIATVFEVFVYTPPEGSHGYELDPCGTFDLDAIGERDG